MTTQVASERPAAREHTTLLLVLSYVGFISLGLPDTVLGAAWPAVRDEFGLPVDAAGAALLVTTGGVVVSSIASGALRRAWGNGAVLIGSTLLAALALLVNALSGTYGHMLLAAAIAGLGGGAIDACLNDFVARRYSARHMNWLHACWGVGAAIGPSVVAAVLARGASWRFAYGLLAAIELLLVLSFVRTCRYWSHDPPAADGGEGGAQPVAARRHALASIAMFFCYGGLEAGTGLWAATLLTETRGVSRAVAGLCVATYWGALCAGRFVIGARADEWGPKRVLAGSVRVAALGSLLFAWPGTTPWLSVAALVVLGFGLAAIYPLSMHDTPRRFGAVWGARLVGYQVAATSLGIAALPWALGALASRTALTHLPAYLCALALCVLGLEVARRR